MTTVASRKWTQVGLLALTVLLAKTVWFSGSAVVPQLTEEALRLRASVVA